MEETRQRLELELNHAMDRIRQLGGAVGIEEFPGAIDDNTPLEDEGHVISPNEDREMSFAIRSMVVERANKLAEALDRLRDGEYGLCVECREPIAPARLRAIPEVTTCLRCQDHLERTRRLGRVTPGFGSDEYEAEWRTARGTMRRRRGPLERRMAARNHA
jgi:RNA polymerase-binding transcription factor DksA